MPKSVSDGFTPGPWRAWIAGKTICILGPKNDHRKPIIAWSGFDACNLPLPKQKANARLIAAAPLLHSVLSRAAKHGDDFSANDWKAFVLEAQAALSLSTTPTDAPKEQEK